MVIDIQIGDRIQCSIDEKRELIPLIDVVVQSAEKARREGLLALEDDLESCEDPLLRLGLQLVVDGTDPEIIDELLTTRIVSSNASGKDLLAKLICYTASLAIQQGNNPRIIEQQCFAYLGDDADTLFKYYSEEIEEPRNQDSIGAFKESDGNFAKRFPELENLLVFDDRSIQKILREIDMKELISICCACSREMKNKFLINMSKRAASLLATDSQKADPSIDLVLNNVDKVMGIIDRLKEAGEIPGS